MKAAVRYFSKGGNTKKLADAIASVAACEAKTVDVPVEEEVDVLFLGASVYAYGIADEVRRFISGMDISKIKKVCVFSTSALAQRAFPEIEKALKDTGVTVDQRNFYCRGSFLMMHKGRPNESDLKDAEAFAKEVLG